RTSSSIVCSVTLTSQDDLVTAIYESKAYDDQGREYTVERTVFGAKLLNPRYAVVSLVGNVPVRATFEFPGFPESSVVTLLQIATGCCGQINLRAVPIVR